MTQDSHSPDDLQDDSVDIQSSSAASASAQGASAAASASSASASTAGQSHPDIEALQAEIVQLGESLSEANEAVLRAQAESQNIRRRAEQDVEKAHKFALEKFVSDMLPVADNLERALAAADGNEGEVSALVEGVELTLKSLIENLKRHNVEQVNPVNEPFDPQLHQAMTAVPNAEVEPNTVLDVFQKGYTLNGRLVRPAMVVVSKAPE